MKVSTIDQLIGNTPMVKLKLDLSEGGLPDLYVKLEGNNPAGSVKDRPASHMIKQALRKGLITTQTPLIEATSGNTGIALAMVASCMKMNLTLVMPEHMSVERLIAMKAYGANIILTSKAGGMEEARDVANECAVKQKAFTLDQFNNDDNWMSHYLETGPEIWKDTDGAVTYFFSSMGTTGTITGVSKYLKEKNKSIKIIGIQPTPGSTIPGIRTWSEGYIPKIYRHASVDCIEFVSSEDALVKTQWLSKTQGIYAGLSSGGVVSIMLNYLSKGVLREGDVAVGIVCDRGDRYTSTYGLKY
ncbi:MAG: pyridoxal-phosphate dependent enzyme [Methylacidiphilales bacterium]|nr:pyridoxal-phosphate dependent enzyme [Candidatus Methylacidiphilales bacterium]